MEPKQIDINQVLQMYALKDIELSMLKEYVQQLEAKLKEQEGNTE